jgi:hypothetical protein
MSMGSSKNWIDLVARVHPMLLMPFSQVLSTLTQTQFGIMFRV